MTESVLVLDGETRAALAVVRSLGELSIEILVASCDQGSLAGASKFTGKSLHSPDPNKDPSAYGSWLIKTVQQMKSTVLLPITNVSLEIALSHEKVLRECTILPFVSYSQYQSVANKERFLQRAAELGVRVPKTVSLDLSPALTLEVLQQSLQDFSFPSCLKPVASDIQTPNGYLKLQASYPQNVDEVWSILAGYQKKQISGLRFLLQEYISGPGVGFFALCQDGFILQAFAHRRLLEKPPSGGASVLCESIAPPGEVYQAARAILSHFQWQGVAMLEFKEAGNGQYFLIELNPRFWGSLQLAIDSGVDFPKKLYQWCVQQKHEPKEIELSELSYQQGLRLRWLLGTMDHAIIRLKRETFSALGDIIFRNSLQLLSHAKETRLEVLRFYDIKPFLAEVKKYFLEPLKRKFFGEKKS